MRVRWRALAEFYERIEAAIGRRLTRYDVMRPNAADGDQDSPCHALPRSAVKPQSRLCDPSQSGCLAERLHVQKNKGFDASALNSTGE